MKRKIEKAQSHCANGEIQSKICSGVNGELLFHLIDEWVILNIFDK